MGARRTVINRHYNIIFITSVVIGDIHYTLKVRRGGVTFFINPRERKIDLRTIIEACINFVQSMYLYRIAITGRCYNQDSRGHDVMTLGTIIYYVYLYCIT